MGIVNALLVEWGDGPVGGLFWVLDEDSIDGTETTPAWGRREGFMSLAGITDTGAATQIAVEHLSTLSQPHESLVVEVAPVDGAEPAVGDIITADTYTDVRTMGVSWKLDQTGDLIPVPEVNSLLDENRRRSSLAVERAIAVNGGRSSSSAPVRVTGARVAAGKLEEVHFTDWSASGEFTLEDLTTWQDQPVRVPCRVTGIEATGKPKPSGPDAVARLLLDGVEFDPPIGITLPYNDDRALVRVFNPLTIFPGSVLTVEVTQLGAHEDFAVAVHAVKGA